LVLEDGADDVLRYVALLDAGDFSTHTSCSRDPVFTLKSAMRAK
jgi:hypothetical protein